MLCPYCNNEIPSTSYSKRRIERTKFILNHITSKITLEELYRVLRKKGYPMKRRTFHRDIDTMHNNNLIKKSVVYSGKKGTYTIISQITKQ